MSNEIQICVRGWLGGAPTMHIGQTGTKLARFRVAVTPRVFDNTNQQFRDGATDWFAVKAWRELAENACASLHKGTPVLVRGKLTTETWTTDGQERSENVITADSVAIDLRNGTAKYTKTIRESAQADAGAHGESEVPAAAGATVTSGDDRWNVTAELPDEEDTDYEMLEEEEQEDLVGATG